MNLNRQSFSNSVVSLWPIFLFYCLLIWLVQDHIFFWDTVQLASKQAHFFYDNDFSSILLPDEIDSGHIPFFGWFLALSWKIFGYNLAVSHWVILPFLWGLSYFSFSVLRYYLPSNWVIPGLILVLFDPTFLAQCTLISPDVFLVFFFFMALHGQIYRRNFILVLAYIGLVLISMRGMMTFGALILFHFWKLGIFGKSFLLHLKKVLMTATPALFIMLVFNIFHYQAKSWIAFHHSSPWSESFQIVGFKEMIYHFGLVIWRILDFGRLLFFIVFLGCFFLIPNKRTSLKHSKITELFQLGLCLGILIIPNLIMRSQLTAHRYLLPIILIILLICITLVFNSSLSRNIKRSFYILGLFSLVSGHLWVYPNHIAQGWDSSLAYLPYHDLKQEVQNYLNDHEINYEQVGAAFPDLSEERFYKLNGSQKKYKLGQLKGRSYVLYSNIYNDYHDDFIQSLEEHGTKIKTFQKGLVFFELYSVDKNFMFVTINK